MSLKTHNTPARVLTLIGLSVMLFLNACSVAATSQIETNSQDELLSSRQSELVAGKPAPKAALPAGEPVAPAAAIPTLSGSGQAINPQAGVVPGQALPMQQAAPAVAGPAQAVSIDTTLPVEPRVGARAPQFNLTTLDGQTVNMDALIGHPVVISYWATWCIPCQQELPILQKLYQEYSGSGLVVLTVNAIEQDSLDDVQTMLAEKGMNLPVLLDEGSTFANEYQALFFPTTYYIDPNGVIRFIKLGDSTEQDLRTHVDSLMRGEL